MTEDNYVCKFPFVHKGNKYWTCIDENRNDLPSGTFWCATDSNKEGIYKSIGKCKQNEFCPKSKSN